MIFDIDECQSLIDWLMDRKFSMAESAIIIGNVECGDSFATSILKVCVERTKKKEIYDQDSTVDWGCPLVP